MEKAKTMKRFLLTTALMMLTATSSLAASVQTPTKTLRAAGYWTAWYVEKNSDSVPMCGMTSEMDVPGGAKMMIKYSATDGTFVHIFKSGWRIPDGTRMPVSLVFDDGTPWSTDGAVGGKGVRDAGLVMFSLRSDSIEKFFTEFGEANTMKLNFEQGTERPWTFNMIGSKEVSAAFANCVLAISKPTSTQPYGNSGTQPFGKPKPKSTQPFGNPGPKLPQPQDGGV